MSIARGPDWLAVALTRMRWDVGPHVVAFRGQGGLRQHPSVELPLGLSWLRQRVTAFPPALDRNSP